MSFSIRLDQFEIKGLYVQSITQKMHALFFINGRKILKFIINTRTMFFFDGGAECGECGDSDA